MGLRVNDRPHTGHHPAITRSVQVVRILDSSPCPGRVHQTLLVVPPRCLRFPPRLQVRQPMMISNTATIPFTIAMMTLPMALTMAIRQRPIAWKTPVICATLDRVIRITGSGVEDLRRRQLRPWLRIAFCRLIDVEGAFGVLGEEVVW